MAAAKKGKNGMTGRPFTQKDAFVPYTRSSMSAVGEEACRSAGDLDVAGRHEQVVGPGLLEAVCHDRDLSARCLDGHWGLRLRDGWAGSQDGAHEEKDRSPDPRHQCPESPRQKRRPMLPATFSSEQGLSLPPRWRRTSPMSDSEPATQTIGVAAVRTASARASTGDPATTRVTEAGTRARRVSGSAARGFDDATRTNRSATGASAATMPGASLSRRIPSTNVTRVSAKTSRSEAAKALAPAGL